MKSYTLSKDAFALGGGEKHPDYGYSYRAFVEEADLPIQFSSHKTNFVEGTRIIAETADVKTAKSSGKDYLWLTKVKTLDNDDSGQTAEPTLAASGKEGSPSRTSPAAGQDKYLKDASTIPLDVYRVRANIDGLPNETGQRSTFFKNVALDAAELLKLIQDVRDGTFSVSKPTKLSGRDLAKAKADEIRGIETMDESELPPDLFPEQE